LAAEQDNPYSGEYLLFEILHYPYFEIRPFTIANLCYELAEMRNKKKIDKTLRGHLNGLIEQHSGTLFSNDDQTNKLLSLARFLESAQTKLHEENLHRWFEFILNESGLLPWAMSQPDRVWQLRKLSSLFHYLKESTQRNPEIKLGEWMEQIRLMKENEIRDRVMSCLEMVNLSKIGNKSTADLSGGMKKRVGLARAIVLEPNYLMYDEPTSGLDPETSDEINDLIIHMAKNLSITSVVISHDMHSVLRVAEKAAFIDEQKLSWYGTIDELRVSDNKRLMDFTRASEYQI
jgi:energy-coupling factor transporter ATP-binding protein EcfA2